MPMLLVLLLLLWAMPVSAATYYVAITGGNDTNSCGAATNATTPRQHLSAGLSCLTGGDTLIVKSGVYAEGIRSNQNLPSGTAGTPTVVKSDTPYGAILRPPNDAAVIDAGTIVLNILNKQFVTIDGFTVDLMNMPQSYHGLQITGATTSNVTVQNMDIGNVSGPPGCGTIRGIFAGGSAFAGPVFLRKNKVHDLHWGTSATCENSDMGVEVSTRNVTIDGNDFTNIAGYCAKVASTLAGPIVTDSAVVSNNACHNTGGTGLLVSSGTNLLVYNNVVWNTAQSASLLHDALRIGGTGWATQSAGVYNNTLTQQGAGCITIVAGPNGTFDTIARNNICWQNASDTITDGGTNTTQDHNLLGTDPLFVNATTADFHLQAGSPAIDTGVSTASLFTTDKDGNPRSVGVTVDYTGVPLTVTQNWSGTNTNTVAPGTSVSLTNFHPTGTQPNQTIYLALRSHGGTDLGTPSCTRDGVNFSKIQQATTGGDLIYIYYRGHDNLDVRPGNDTINCTWGTSATVDIGAAAFYNVDTSAAEFYSVLTSVGTSAFPVIAASGTPTNMVFGWGAVGIDIPVAPANYIGALLTNGAQAVDLRSFIVGAGANEVLFVGITSPGPLTTTVTWDGQALALLDAYPIPNALVGCHSGGCQTQANLYWYYMLAPHPGNKVLHVSWSNTTSNWGEPIVDIGAVAFAGVNQTTPFAAMTHTFGEDTSFADPIDSITIPTNPGDATVALWGSTFMEGCNWNQTPNWPLDAHGINSMSSRAAGVAGTNTHSLHHGGTVCGITSGGNWGMSGFNIKATGIQDRGAYEFFVGGPPPSTNPSAWWKYDEGTGASVADATGNGHLLQLLNAPTWTPGRVGPKSLTLDGISQVGQASGLMGTSTATSLTTWVQVLSLASGGRAEILSIGDYVALQLSPTQLVGHWYAGNGVWEEAIFPTTALVGGAWHHIVYVANPAQGASQLYLDGVLVATNTATGAISFSGLGSDVFLGRHGQLSTFFLNGRLDETHIDNTALTPAQVLALYRGTAGMAHHKVLAR